MSGRAPCVRCGQILHTGEGRVIVSLSRDDLVEIINDTRDVKIRARLLCALSLIDNDLAKELS